MASSWVPSTVHSDFDVVAIVTSLGGLQALRTVLGALPADFPVPVVAHQHLAFDRPSRLKTLLESCTPLPVRWLRPSEPVRAPGVALVPPGFQAAFRRKNVRLTPVWPAHRHFAADALLSSAAAAFGSRTLAVVLTGDGSDGFRGALDVRAAGGAVIAQDPATALAPGMPRAVVAGHAHDLVLPLAAIAPALVALVMVRGAYGHVVGKRVSAAPAPSAP